MRDERRSRSCLAAQMQKLWNLRASAARARVLLVALVTLWISLSGCTAQIDGSTSTRGLPNGSSASMNTTGNQLMCQPGLSACSGACVNLQADSATCGACGTACTAP